MAFLWMDGFDHYYKNQTIYDAMDNTNGATINNRSTSYRNYVDMTGSEIQDAVNSTITSINSAEYTAYINQNPQEHNSGNYDFYWPGIYITDSPELSGNCLVLSSSEESTNYAYVEKEINDWVDKLYFGFRCKTQDPNSSQASYPYENYEHYLICTFFNSNNEEYALWIRDSDYDGGRALNIRSTIAGSTESYNTYDSTISNQYLPEEWNFIEVQIDTIDKKIRLWINNRLCHELLLEDMDVPLMKESTRIRFGRNNLTYSSVQQQSRTKLLIDDFYIVDAQEGDTPEETINSRLGIIHIDTRSPTTEVDVNFDRSEGDYNYELLDDFSPDGDGTFTYSSTANNSDLFSSNEEIGLNPVIAVGVTVNGRRTGGDSRAITPFIEGSLYTYLGTPVPFKSIDYGMSTGIFEVDPNTGNAWSNSGAQNVQFGYRLSGDNE